MAIVVYVFGQWMFIMQCLPCRGITIALKLNLAFLVLSCLCAT